MPAKLIATLAARPDVRQFVRFVIVGAIATSVQFAVLIALVELGHADKLAANVAGYLCGAVVSYVLNRRFTFAGTQTAFARGFGKFMIVNLIGLAINFGVFAGLIALSLHYMLAQIVATGIVLIWNYAGSRLFVFR